MTAYIWRAGLVPAAAVGAVVVVVGALAGAAGALGALVGTALALMALSVPVLVVRATATAPPPAVIGAALGGYLLCVVALGAVWALLSEAGWLSGDHLAAALFAVTAAWMAGQLRGLVRMRVLAFGDGPPGAPAPHDVPGQAGDGAA